MIPNVERYNEAEDKLFQQCLKKTFGPLTNDPIQEQEDNNKLPVSRNIEIKEKNEHLHQEKVKIFNIREDRTNILSKQNKDETNFLEKKTLRKEDNVVEKVDDMNISKVSQNKYITSVMNESSSIPVKLSCIDESNYLSRNFRKIVMMNY